MSRAKKRRKAAMKRKQERFLDRICLELMRRIPVFEIEVIDRDESIEKVNIRCHLLSN